jgi:hypothetical protein
VTGWSTVRTAGPANESGQALNFIVTDNNSGLFSARDTVTPLVGQGRGHDEVVSSPLVDCLSC